MAAGLTATVMANSTLELDGSQPALVDSGHLTDPAYRAAVDNAGAFVVGDGTIAATQQVGGIDGAGSTTVSDSSNLTADHIVQASLVIGNGSTFTLAPSDMNGNAGWRRSQLAVGSGGTSAGRKQFGPGRFADAVEFVGSPRAGGLLGALALVSSPSAIALQAAASVGQCERRSGAHEPLLLLLILKARDTASGRLFGGFEPNGCYQHEACFRSRRTSVAVGRANAVFGQCVSPA